MKQRMLSALLAASMVLTMAPAAFAADAAEGELENITWGENNTYKLSADTTLKSVYTIDGDTDAVYTIDLDTRTLTVDTIKVAPNNELDILSSTTGGTVKAVDAKKGIEFQVGGKLTLGPKVTFADPVSIYALKDDTTAILAAIPQLVNRVATGKTENVVTLKGGDFAKGLTVDQPTIIPADAKVEGTITVQEGAKLTVEGTAGTIVAGKDTTIDVTGKVDTIQIVEGAQPTITAPEGTTYEIVTVNGEVKATHEVMMNVAAGGTADLYSTTASAGEHKAPAKSENSNVYLISEDATQIVVVPKADAGYEVEKVTLAVNGTENDLQQTGERYTYDKALTSDATITVTFTETSGGSSGSSGGGSSSANKPSVSVSGAGGKVTASSNGTVTITPDEGYEIAKITVNGKEVAIPATAS